MCVCVCVSVREREREREKERELHISKCNFTENHKANVVCCGSATVVCTLGHHVSKVDSLPKHITCCWRLRWSNSKTLIVEE